MKSLACLALGVLIGTVAALSLVYRREPAPEPYTEPEDGVQPVDPYLDNIAVRPIGDPRGPRFDEHLQFYIDNGWTYTS